MTPVDRHPADPWQVKPTALLLTASDVGAADAADAVEAAGARVVASLNLSEAVAAIADHGGVDLILIEAAGAEADTLDGVLDAISGASAGPAIVISFAQPQIDLIASRLLTGPVHLLCDPTMAERVAALVLAARGNGPARERDSEAERLRRLNEEVARIAETLARLTRGEGTVDRALLGDRSVAYRARTDDSKAGASDVVAADVRKVIRARRLRDQFFAPGLLEDPAWDMLLDLFAAELERAQVSVSSLCIAAAVAPTTALRWIGRMTEDGLFERTPDPFDKRRAFMVLSETARTAMRGYWAALQRSGGAVV